MFLRTNDCYTYVISFQRYDNWCLISASGFEYSFFFNYWLVPIGNRSWSFRVNYHKIHKPGKILVTCMCSKQDL